MADFARQRGVILVSAKQDPGKKQPVQPNKKPETADSLRPWTKLDGEL